jgi:hypothetical protein
MSENTYYKDDKRERERERERYKTFLINARNMQETCRC